MFNKLHIYPLVISALLIFALTSCGHPSNEPLVTRIDAPSALRGDIPTASTSSPDNLPIDGIDFSADDSSQSADTTPETEARPQLAPTRISFLAAGDNVIHPCIYMDAERRADETTREYNFKPMYADVADYIAGFDIAFINQETLMGGAELGYSGYPQFNSPQDLGLDLIDIGFDVVNIANNHMCDKGTAGLAGTIDFWNSQDILMIGGYTDADDYDDIRVLEYSGVKIAFLSYTYGTNGISLPSSSELIIPYINDDDIIRQCKLANECADFVIASVHWGNENQTTVSADQRYTAELLANNGVDVILGHHPHVLQPIEWISSDSGETLCIYSLGNLVSAMQYWQNMVGGFFTFDIVVDENGDIYADSPEFSPTAFYYGPSYYNSHLYFLSEYPADVAKTHGTGNLYGSPATPDDMKRFAEDIMGEYIVYE